MSFTLNFSTFEFLVIPSLFAMLYAVLLPWVVVKTDFLPLARSHLRRFAPLYLIVGPPAVTYLAICGFLSATYFTFAYPAAHSEILGQSEEFIRRTTFFRGLYIIEWISSFIGVLLFGFLFRWLRLPRIWFLWLFLSLAMSAVYRTAACRNIGIDHFQFQSGPHIQLNPDWIDIMPIILGFVTYHVVLRRRNETPLTLDEQNAEPELPITGT